MLWSKSSEMLEVTPFASCIVTLIFVVVAIFVGCHSLY